MTQEEIILYLDNNNIDYKFHKMGGILIKDKMLVYWDEQDPQNIGWAVRTPEESYPVDDIDELNQLYTLIFKE